MTGAEEALAALARDLVEEIAAARAAELAAGQTLELAASPTEPDRSVGWRGGQRQWKAEGDALWGLGGRWDDLDPEASAKFLQHVEKAHRHLAPKSGPPALADGYTALHEAHRIGAEHLLPRAETDAQKQSVRDAMAHVQSRMRDIDKLAGAGATRTSRLTGNVAERAARAQEAMAEPAHPMVMPEKPEMPPPPKGAHAVHPHLGHHLARLPGLSISQHELAHVARPFEVPPQTPEGAALEQANKRLAKYAEREEKARQADLNDHLRELRKGEAELHRSEAEKQKQREAAAAKRPAPRQPREREPGQPVGSVEELLRTLGLGR